MIIINENIKTLMSLSENVSDWAVGCLPLPRLEER